MTDNSNKNKRTGTSTSGNVKRIFDVYEPLVCKQCNKSFEKKSSLKSHLKAHEFDDHVYESKRKTKSDKFKAFTCNVCNKGFTAKKNLLKHLRVIHKNLNEAEKLQVKKTRCPESNCLFACRKMGDLRNHIEKFHEIKILKDTLHFLNEEGFLKWKKEEEDNSVASFVSFRRKGILKNGMAKKVLLCHRTGQYNPKGKGKHRLKSHGSCKIGGTCPAAMEIIQCPDGQITVSYYKTHLGHSKDVVHLQLSREDREKLLALFPSNPEPYDVPLFLHTSHLTHSLNHQKRIEQGFSIDAILEDVKESIDPETGKTKRLHLLSRKDIYNLMQSCNKKIKTNVKDDMDELFLNVNEGTEEIDANKFQNASDLEIGKEQELQLLRTEDIAVNHLTVGGDVEHDQSFNREFQILQNEIPSDNSEILNNGSSQLVIVSPDPGYKSLAEVIVFQSDDTVAQSTSKPAITPQNEETKIRGKKRSKSEDKKVSRTRKSDVKNIKTQALILQLEEKMKKVCDSLPKSEFLTPKQYEVVNRKLDSIINVYNSVNVEAKSKKLGVKNIENEKGKGKGKGKSNAITEKKKLGIECIFNGPQNAQQQVYESPFYAYVCNYN